jgi:hypothetical protein
MMARSSFNFQTGAWTKRAIRKLDTDEDEDRKLAETIAAETLPGRSPEQKELAAWLLAKPSRLARLRRDREAAQRVDAIELRSRKDWTMANRETLIAKGDAIGLATHICKNGGGDLSEAGFTQIVTDYAVRLHPSLTPEAAFTKAFDARDAAGALLRRAHAVVAGRLPDDKERDDEEERERERDDDNGDALSEFNEKAAQLRKARPDLSPEQAFAKVFEDPANRRLAARERKQNSPLRRVV